MSNEQPERTLSESGEEVLAEKTKQETDRKCPQCGATMDFAPDTGGLRCAYCGHEDEVTLDAEARVEELSFDSALHRENIDWGAEKKQVVCKSCGAATIYDQLEVANECPFCGSNHVMQEKSVDSLPPGAVAPFEIDAKQAETRFGQWLKSRIFAPSKAKKEARADRFTGLYLPYWTFDSKTESNYTAKYGRDRVETDSKGNSRVVTDWYKTSGSFAYFADDVLVLGSTRHETNALARIEPYDFERLKPYRPEYLAGFVSERYSLGIDDAWLKARDKINNTLEGEITHTIRSRNKADRVSNLRFDTRFFDRAYKYILLPLWMSKFAFKGKTYEFLVNGQTGKVAGKIPLSALRVAIAVALGLALLFLLFYMINQR